MVVKNFYDQNKQDYIQKERLEIKQAILQTTYSIKNGNDLDKISINELFAELKKITGSKLNATYRDSRQGDVRESLADISKARTILGYEPTVRIEEGLKRTVEWFKK